VERFSAALLKSHYKDLPEVDQNLGVQKNLQGKSLDLTPRFAATLTYAHEWTFPSGGTLRAQAETKFSTSYVETDVSNVIQYTQPAFTRSNMDIRYTTPGGKFYVGAFVQNLENKLQINSNPNGFVPNRGSDPAPGPNGNTVPNAATVTVTDPRTWGFTTGVKF